MNEWGREGGMLLLWFKSANFEVGSGEVSDNLNVILVCGTDLKSNWVSVNLSFFGSISNWLHGWEKHDFLDVVSVSQEHGDSINTTSPTSGWW